MIKIDHKRDVRKFSKATEFEDEYLSEFAKKYLPVIKLHLAGIEKIKKRM